MSEFILECKSLSYKIKKKVEKNQDDWQIIPNTQEAIIDNSFGEAKLNSLLACVSTFS